MQLLLDLVGCLPQRFQEGNVIGPDDAKVRVLVPGPALELDQVPHRPAVERLGLAQLVGVPQQLRQVVQAGGDGGVVQAVAPLGNGPNPTLVLRGAK